MTRSLDEASLDTLPEARATATGQLPDMTTNRQRIWRRFKAHRPALLSAALLGVFYFLALFANFFAPYSETFEDRTKSLAPPTAVFWRSEEGRFSWPFVYEGRQ